MAEDASKKIKQLIDILGQDGSAEGVKNIVEMLANSLSKESGQKKSDYDSPQENKQERGDIDDQVDMMRKVKKVLDVMNSRDDPKTTLLLALKPYLNIERQKKIGMYIRTLNMTRVVGLINEFPEKD